MEDMPKPVRLLRPVSPVEGLVSPEAERLPIGNSARDVEKGLPALVKKEKTKRVHGKGLTEGDDGERSISVETQHGGA